MRINVNFNTINLVDNGIVLGLKNNQKREITFSELNHIYIKEYKIKPVFELLIILFPFLFIFFAIHYIMMEEVMVITLFVVVPIFVKIYGCKRNDLVVRLKDGTVFRKIVPFKIKSEDVIIVKAAKSACRRYGIKSKGFN